MNRPIKTSTHWSNWHILSILLGIGFILFGIFLPHSWYTPLPAQEVPEVPSSIGPLLFQLTLIAEGLVLLGLGLTRWHFVRLDAKNRLPSNSSGDTLASDTATSRDRRYFWLVLCVTMLALILRLISSNSNLWLDEISTMLTYGKATFLQLFSSYISANNHLLNTLGVKFAVAVLGQHDWVIRLPAILFGTLTIPAFYWVARQLFSQRASLCAALLLAVSYHHIFFSQNARGYTAYLFFSLVASGLLVKGLREDRRRYWVLYILAMYGNVGSDLIGFFVLIAHGLIVVLALAQIWRSGSSPLPMLRRVIGVLGVTAFLGFQLYAAVFPQIIAYTKVVNSDASAGYPPFSAAFFQELFRGISTGFGPGLLLGALPFLAIAALGFLILLRRNWPLILGLLLPPAIHAAFLTLRGLVFSPRFFLLTLLLAMLTAVAGIELVATQVSKWLRRGPAFTNVLNLAGVALVCLVFVIPLRYYYAVPKQDYTSSLQYVLSIRQPNDIIIVIYLAGPGYQYYGDQVQFQEGKDYFYARTADELTQILAANKDKNPILVNTFPRALSIRYPDLADQIQRGWTVMRIFPGTIGDGDITVMKRVDQPNS